MAYNHTMIKYHHNVFPIDLCSSYIDETAHQVREMERRLASQAELQNPNLSCIQSYINIIHPKSLNLNVYFSGYSINTIHHSLPVMSQPGLVS